MIAMITMYILQCIFCMYILQCIFCMYILPAGDHNNSLDDQLDNCMANNFGEIQDNYAAIPCNLTFFQDSL